MQTLPELRRQTLVCLDLIEEQGVASSSGTIQQVQEGCAWGLPLVADIRVPSDGVGVLLKELIGKLVIGAPVDEVDLWESLRCTRSWVDVVTAKVSTKLQSLFDREIGKVLTDNLPLGDKQGQLVLCFVTQLAQLHAMHLGANVRRELSDLCLTLWQQVWETRVGIFSVVVMLEWLKRRVPIATAQYTVSYCRFNLLSKLDD